MKKANYLGKLKERLDNCHDEIEIALEIEKNKIVKADFKSEGCSKLKAACQFLTKLIKGKNIKEAVKITASHISNELKFGKEDKHAAQIAVSALHLAFDDFHEKTKGDPLKDVMNLLDKYDEGLPKRDFRDYEMCECGKEHDDKPETIELK